MSNDIVVTKEEKPIQRISTYLDRPESVTKFMQLLGDEKNARRFIASVLTAVAGDEKLQSCTPQSIYISAVRSATLGLSVDPAFGQAYLVAYKNICTFMPGYKGLVDFATANGLGVHVTPVFENEIVEENPMNGEVRLNTKTGAWRTVYNASEESSNGYKVTGYLANVWDNHSSFKKSLFWTVAQIEEYAEMHAPAYKNSSSPWNKNKLTRIEMMKKTVLKTLLRKYAPLNPVVSHLLEAIKEENREIEHEALMSESLEGVGLDVVEEKKSQLELMSELGYDNPDPVKDATWNEWEALQARAVKNGVDVVVIVKAKTTESDLKLYMQEILMYVTDAERQAES